MKKVLSLFCFCFVFCGVNANRIVNAEVTPYRNVDGDELAENVARVTFEFERTFYCEKRETVPGRQVRFYFPELSIADFTKFGIVEKIRCIPIVESAFLHYEQVRVPVPRVVLVINFARDSVFLRITKDREMNLLTIDMFEKAALELYRRQSTTLRCACNNAVKKKDQSSREST
jgi:hypothetical protein